MNDQPLHPMRFKWFRVLRARPRLLASALIGLASIWLMPASGDMFKITRLIIGWNIGACLYLVLAAHMMFWSTHEKMRSRALEEDEGQLIILALVITGAIMSIGAVIAELSVAKQISGTLRYAHIGLTVLTIVTSWVFTQVMFALHYAHDYYAAEGRNNDGGLTFPGGHLPDYGDFLYFAFVIGTSNQTADISLTSRRMRRTGLAHCVLAFIFNTTLLALTVNIAAGLF